MTIIPASEMGKKQKLSHEEIWDDSALIASWDEALEEYKHYHSLHARGEKVEDVVRKYEQEQENECANSKQKPEDGSAMLNNAPFNSENRDIRNHSEVEDGEVYLQHTPANLKKQNENVDPVTASSENTVPHALIASVQDESLKSLMMSWYYAGYYTGFYEGQQQALHKSGSAAKQMPTGGDG